MPPPPVPNNPCLFLDADGTLLEFADAPDAVVATDRVKALVESLPLALDGAFAIVSGRPIRELDEIFGAGDFAAAGIHGLEVRSPGRGVAVLKTAADGLADLLERAEQFADGRDGVLFENKHYGFALHYRKAPWAEAQVRDYMKSLVPQGGNDFEIQEGHKVVELKLSGVDKGLAIQQFMTQNPFSGRVPVFIGDDRTDEKGFLVVNEQNGVSVKVGKGDSYAQFRLPDVAAVLVWLEGFHKAVTNG